MILLPSPFMGRAGDGGGFRMERGGDEPTAAVTPTPGPSPIKGEGSLQKRSLNP